MWLLLLFILLIAAASYWMVGRLISVLVKRQIVDTPNQRSLHQGSVPRGGGLVIIAMLVLSLIILGLAFGRVTIFITFALLIFAWSSLSWWDDRRDLSPRIRLLIQMLLTLVTLLAFGYVNSVQLSADHFINLLGMGFVLTFVGVIWLANLYNFMDGMDGLAASQTIIASITLGVWFGYLGDVVIAVSSFVLAAASYGFLLWNWHPAKIFMGDVGSVGIGAFFATAIIYGNTRYQIPVLSCLLLFGVFVFDASTTIIRRTLCGEKIWLPHRSHYYQRLAELGFRHDQIVIGLIVVMLLCSVIATVSVVDRDRIVVAIIIELIALIGGAVLVVFKEKNQRFK
jgi:Fuc2NAc and GlcNAc transferase